MTKKVLYSFIFETEIKEDLDINSTVQDFIDTIVPNEKMHDSLKNFAHNQFSRNYKHVIPNQQIFYHFESKYYDLLLEYFTSHPKLKLLFRVDTNYIDLLDKLKRILEEMGNLTFLLGQDLTSIKLFTKNLRFKTLEDYQEALFRILGLQTLSSYEEIRSYIEKIYSENDSHDPNKLVDLKIKNLVEKLIEEKVNEKIDIYNSFITKETEALNAAISSVFRNMIYRNPEFQELKQRYSDLSSTDVSKQIRSFSGSLYENLYTAWKTYEGLLSIAESSPEELTIAEQNFKISFIKLCIQIKKYLEEFKLNNRNRWLTEWIVKLLNGLNSFLSFVKSNKNHMYGFSVLPKEKTNLMAIQGSVAIQSIKQFLEEKENVELLFPQKLGKLFKSLNAFKSFFRTIENFSYFRDRPDLSGGISPPELLLATIDTTS